MKLIKYISIYFLLFSLLVPPAAFGQGKSQNAPGQMKKEEKQENKPVTVGNVESVSKNSIVVEEKNKGKKTEAVVDKSTKVVGQDKKLLKIENVKPKDKVAILSDDAATESAKPKKAIKIFVKHSTESAQMKRRAVHGIITEISGSIITLVHQIQQDRVFKFLVNDQTVIKTKDSESSGSAALAVGQRIAAVGDLQEDGTLLAKRIHVIPGKAIGVFKRFKVATPSATTSITPTSVATPSVTITPTIESTPSPTLSTSSP